MKKRKWFLPSSISTVVHTDIKSRVQSEPLHIYIGDFVNAPPPAGSVCPIPEVSREYKKPGPKPKPIPPKPAAKVKRRRRKKSVPAPKKIAPGIQALTSRRVNDDDFDYLINRRTGHYTRCPAVSVFKEKLEELLDRGYELVSREEYFDLKGR